MPALTQAPGQPSLLEGFLNLRGAAVPVIRLRRLFGLDGDSCHLYTPLVILESGGLTVALQADAVDEIVEVDDASIRLLGEGHSANDCAEAIFGWNGQDITLLFSDSLLLAKERECLSELQAAVEQRLNELGPIAG